MADRMACAIHFPKCALENAEVMKAVLQEWGGSEADLELALTSERMGEGLGCDEAGIVSLCDHEARWGEFEKLECLLEKHGYPFIAYADGRYEYHEEIRAYNPAWGVGVQSCLSWQQEPIVTYGEIQKMRDVAETPEAFVKAFDEQVQKLHLNEVGNFEHAVLVPFQAAHTDAAVN